MKRALCVALGLTFAALAVGVSADGTAGKKPSRAQHAVKLADPAGDVVSVSVGEGEYPGLDVVELALSSDGAELTVTATLKNKIGKLADTTVEMNIDTDDNPGTGGQSL